MNKLSAVLVGLLLVSPGFAAPNGAKGNSAPQGPSQRSQLVHDIVMKWGPYVQEAYKLDVRRWTKEMASVFAGSDLDQLQKAGNARTFESMNDQLLGIDPAASALTITPAALGSTVDDLVFTPVAPCRILDTRIAGGKLGTNATRNFDVTVVGNYTAQGGSATNCNVGNQGSFKAAVVTFAVVDPENRAFLTAYQFNTTRPLAATMTYDVGQLISNTAIVPLDQTGAAEEMSVYNNGRSHVVADIVGYFDAPGATALQCVETASTDAVIAANNSGFSTALPACPAGYSQTGIRCDQTSFAGTLVSINDDNCAYRAGALASTTVQAYRKCCRVPGK